MVWYNAIMNDEEIVTELHWELVIEKLTQLEYKLDVMDEYLSIENENNFKSSIDRVVELGYN